MACAGCQKRREYMRAAMQKMSIRDMLGLRQSNAQPAPTFAVDASRPVQQTQELERRPQLRLRPDVMQKVYGRR